MANLDQITKSLEKWAVGQVNAMQDNLVTGIKADTPVDTGRARDGTVSTATVKKIGDTGIISNEVPYIGFLEFGTDKTFEHAMFRRNIAKVNK